MSVSSNIREMNFVIKNNQKVVSSLSKALATGRRASSAEDPVKDSKARGIERTLGALKIFFEGIGIAGSVVEVAESNVQSILENIKELTKIATMSNNTIDLNEKKILNNQFQGVVKANSSIAEAAKFGVNKLLDGNYAIGFVVSELSIEPDIESEIKAKLDKAKSDHLANTTNNAKQKPMSLEEENKAREKIVKELKGAKDTLVQKKVTDGLRKYEKDIEYDVKIKLEAEKSAGGAHEEAKIKEAIVNQYKQRVLIENDPTRQLISFPNLSMEKLISDVGGSATNQLSVENDANSQHAMDILYKISDVLVAKLSEISALSKSLGVIGVNLESNIMASENSYKIMTNIDEREYLAEFKSRNERMTAASYILAMTDRASQEAIRALYS